MFGLDWEFIGVVLAIIAAFWGAITAFIRWRAKAAVSEERMTILTGKVKSIEDDLKLLTGANASLADTFKRDVKELLLEIKGQSDE